MHIEVCLEDGLDCHSAGHIREKPYHCHGSDKAYFEGGNFVSFAAKRVSCSEYSFAIFANLLIRTTIIVNSWRGKRRMELEAALRPKFLADLYDNVLLRDDLITAFEIGLVTAMALVWLLSAVYSGMSV